MLQDRTDSPTDYNNITSSLQPAAVDTQLVNFSSPTMSSRIPSQAEALSHAMPWRPGYKPTPCGSMCQLVLRITTAAPAPGSAV